jgi:cytoskeletal protein RodZ
MARGIFGERLKRERELREVTLDEITSATRIGPRFLLALENEEWEKLPGGVFNRGFVRSIARYLGLDEEELLAEYDLAHAPPFEAGPEQKEDRIPSPPRWFPFVLALGFLLLLAALVAGGFYGWRYYKARRARASSASPVSMGTTERILFTAAPSAASTPRPASPLPASRETIDPLVSCGAATRTRIPGGGTLRLDAEFPSGENPHSTARNEFEVTAADSTEVLLELNGKATPPVGAPGVSGTITVNRLDLRQTNRGTNQS